jgi:shikimate dehydrogenase
LLTGSTRLVGIIGNPVSHSLSPRMQNAAFAALRLDWAYVPLPVDGGRLREAVSGLVALGFAGANVTIPHKSAVLSFCDEIDDVAQRAASANTLVIRGGRVHASSTDGLAVTTAVDCRGARVLLLGAGGAARAVATAIADAGAQTIRIASRTAGRASDLASRLSAQAPAVEVEPLEDWPPDPGDATLIVNATPLRDEVVVDPRPHQQVVDLAYREDGLETALVAAARAVGSARVVDGLEVLVRQGAASFERWTGRNAPVEAMRSAVQADEAASASAP